MARTERESDLFKVLIRLRP